MYTYTYTYTHYLYMQSYCVHAHVRTRTAGFYLNNHIIILGGSEHQGHR